MAAGGIAYTVAMSALTMKSGIVNAAVMAWRRLPVAIVSR